MVGCNGSPSVVQALTQTLIQEGHSPPLYLSVQLLKQTTKSIRLLEVRRKTGGLTNSTVYYTALIHIKELPQQLLANLTIDIAATNAAKVFQTPSVNLHVCLSRGVSHQKNSGCL